MVRKKSPAAHRPNGRKLTRTVWQSWLGVVVAVITLALIALMTVLVIRQAADTGDGCGKDVTSEHPGDRWVDVPDERVGEDAGCSAPAGKGQGLSDVRYRGAFTSAGRHVSLKTFSPASATLDQPGG